MKLTDSVKNIIGEEAFTRLKVLLSTNQKFMEEKLVDGTMIRYDGDLVQGCKILVAIDGNYVPAPDGTHEIETGTKITTKDGAVTEIIEKEEMDDSANADDNDNATIATSIDDLMKKISSTEQSMAAMLKENESLKSTIETLNQEFATVKNSADSIIVEVKNLVNKISDVPVVPPLPQNGGYKKSDKFSEVSKLIHEIKNK